MLYGPGGDFRDLLGKAHQSRGAIDLSGICDPVRANSFNGIAFSDRNVSGNLPFSPGML